MRLSSIAITVGLLVAGVATAAAQDAHTIVLQAAAAAPPEALAREVQSFFAALDAKSTGFSGDEMQTARERLFFLIGSAAQAQLRTSRKYFPPRDTLGMRMMLDRASRLGTYGTGLVARALSSRETGELTPTLLPEPPLHLSFTAPDYTLRSESGWSIRFPYLFMIGAAQTGVPSNRVPTETVVLSGLFGVHHGLPGFSQSTIMLNSAQATDSTAFFAYWRKMIGLDESDRASTSPLPSSVSYHRFDANAPMHKELVTLVRGQTVMMIGYFGLPGTYESNRPDFLALLQSLKFNEGAR